jgi:hypothetical protein
LRITTKVATTSKLTTTGVRRGAAPGWASAVSEVADMNGPLGVGRGLGRRPLPLVRRSDDTHIDIGQGRKSSDPYQAIPFWWAPTPRSHRISGDRPSPGLSVAANARMRHGPELRAVATPVTSWCAPRTVASSGCSFPRGGPSLSGHAHFQRIDDCQVAEHWAVRDDQGQAMQLGWVPPTPRFLIRCAAATRKGPPSGTGPGWRRPTPMQSALLSEPPVTRCSSVRGGAPPCCRPRNRRK